jgi:DNA-binding beta-propeller fold protein YncE
VVPVPLGTRQPGPPVAVIDSPRLEIDPQGKLLYVVGGHGLQTVDVASDKVLRSHIETGNLVSFWPAADGRTLIALDNSGAALVQIDVSTLATSKSLSLGSRPDHLRLSPDGTRAYILDTSDQKLYVVGVAAWSIAETVDVSPDALNFAVPSATP